MAVALGCAFQASLNHGSTLKEYDTDCEVFRQQFRNFQYQRAMGPHEVFNNLWELCSQWLKPKMRSKEEILELLVLEQFLTILPSKIQTWVRLCHPENRERILGLVEELQRELEVPEQQVVRQNMRLEELAPVGTTHIPPNSQMELRALGPSQESTVAEATEATQAGPQNMNYDAAGECQPFPEPDFEISRENEEDFSKQNKPGNTYAFLFNFEGNVFHGPNLPTVHGQSENQRGNLPQQSQLAYLLGYQKYSPGEKPNSNNVEAPLSLGPHQKNTEKKSHQCYRCGKCFDQKSQLNGHQKVHSGEEPHKCPHCRKSFRHSSDLHKHQQFHVRERPYECSVCQKRFTHSAHLRGHQRTHSKETYDCFQCGKTFCYGATLKRHQRIHTGERPYKCCTCGKGFIQQSALTSHQRTHTGERPFKCNYCEKSFKHKTSLTIHIRIHTGEKPYQCSYCSKAFRQRTGLITHQASHFREEFLKKC